MDLPPGEALAAAPEIVIKDEPLDGLQEEMQIGIETVSELVVKSEPIDADELNVVAEESTSRAAGGSEVAVSQSIQKIIPIIDIPDNACTSSTVSSAVSKKKKKLTASTNGIGRKLKKKRAVQEPTQIRLQSKGKSAKGGAEDVIIVLRDEDDITRVERFADINDEDCVLDLYNCDLNLKLQSARLEAQPFTQDGFAYMWAGIKATYGVSTGRVAFQVKVSEYLNVPHLGNDEPLPHSLRVGWSLEEASLQLGEYCYTYGYTSTGKAAESCKFRDYGPTFGVGDVITALLDFDTMQISYMKNDEHCGPAFTLKHAPPPEPERPRTPPVSENSVPGFAPTSFRPFAFLRAVKKEIGSLRVKNEPQDMLDFSDVTVAHLPPALVSDPSANGAPPPPIVLFPHIATRNCRFQVNFGKLKKPWFPLPEGYVWMNSVPVGERTRSKTSPKDKKDCQIIMLIGLPGSGKTTWCQKYIDEHPNERFTVLGSGPVLGRMTLEGMPRRKNYKGRWDVLLGMATKCIQRLFIAACRKKRNYIFDQTNVFPAARKRKLNLFREFRRRAVVFVPSHAEYQMRLRKQQMEEGKQLPVDAMNTMKAGFVVPTDHDLLFKHGGGVQFVELPRADAVMQVVKYAQEAAQLVSKPMHGQKKRISKKTKKGKTRKTAREKEREKEQILHTETGRRVSRPKPATSLKKWPQFNEANRLWQSAAVRAEQQLPNAMASLEEDEDPTPNYETIPSTPAPTPSSIPPPPLPPRPMLPPPLAMPPPPMPMRPPAFALNHGSCGFGGSPRNFAAPSPSPSGTTTPVAATPPPPPAMMMPPPGMMMPPPPHFFPPGMMMPPPMWPPGAMPPPPMAWPQPMPQWSTPPPPTTSTQ